MNDNHKPEFNEKLRQAVFALNLLPMRVRIWQGDDPIELNFYHDWLWAYVCGFKEANNNYRQNHVT
jgi:hypothetical protein